MVLSTFTTSIKKYRRYINHTVHHKSLYTWPTEYAATDVDVNPSVKSYGISSESKVRSPTTIFGATQFKALQRAILTIYRVL